MAKDLVVTAKCVGCKATKEVREGEVPRGSMPICDKCGNVMVAVRAKLVKRK